MSTSGILFMDLNYWALAVCLFAFGIAASSQAVTFGLVHDRLPNRVAGTAVGFNNMAVIFGGMSCQPLAAFLLEKISDTPATPSAHDYQVALLIVPALYLLGIIIHWFFIEETYCCNQHEELTHEH